MGFLSGISSFVKEHSDVIHGVLDVAGFIPGIGAVADLANAGLYAAEGDYLNAGLSLVSAIPGIGDTVALAKKSVNAVKGGLKGLKGMKNINALKKAKGIKKALSGLRGKAKTGASRPKKAKVKKKGKLYPQEDAINAIKKDQKKGCVNGKCFTGDTLVYTNQGYKFIKEIQKGDEVYSRNEETGETGLKEVEEVFCTTANTIYHVWVDGKEEFRITAYHPVYVQEQGWVTAINLRVGDTINTMNGFAYITKVEKTRHEEPVIVYNFHVKDWTSYFVGKIRGYVHNDEKIEHKGLGISDEDIIEGYKKIESFRKKAGLKAYSEDSGDTVAYVVINRKTYFGVNSTITKESHAASIELRRKWLKEIEWVPPKKKIPKHLGCAQSLTHAEAHSLIRAYERQGTLPEKVTMYVDRKTCNICRGELPALLKRIGVKELKVFSGNSRKPIIIKATE
ncbi:MAG: hypothetical protein HFH68_14515 [Lachnospiraceae bacterium]|nr:hypothetical protein [Lachnospiraceae bacterium]